MTAEPLVSVRDLLKNYNALRPLRIQQLTVDAAQIMSLAGVDAQAAEMLIGLLTGAMLPDSGEVKLLGRSTADVADSDAWLAMLDAVGILTDRAVLIGQFSVEQNIAMPFTLQVDPVSAAVKADVEALAREVGLDEAQWQTPVARVDSAAQARVRLARAIALKPRLLLAEHPSAALSRDDVVPFARDLGRIARARGLAVLALTADDAFARALGGETLTHEPATGALKPHRVWRKLFG